MRNIRVPFVLLLAAVVLSAVIAGFLFQAKIRTIHGLRASLASPMREPVSGSDLGADRKYLKKLYPPESGIPGFLEQMHGMARRNGVQELFFEQRNREMVMPDTGKTVRPQSSATTAVATLYRFPVRVSFKSGYRQMAEFIREIQGMERMVTVENLHGRKDKGSLLTEMTVVIYATGEK